MAEKSMVLGVVVGGEDPLQVLRVVHSMGFPTCQLYAPPASWNAGEKAARIEKEAQKQGVQITSLICAFPGEDYSSLETIKKTVGLVNPQTREERIARVISVADLAADIGVKIVQGHLGFIPERDTSEYKSLVKDVQMIADHLEKNGQFFALETGQESGTELLQLIEDIDRDNVKVNFDPANFLIYNSDDPLAALEVLKDFVVGVHCKDGKRPEKKGELGKEVPLGEGDVGIERFISKLKEMNYEGPLTIEREISDEKSWREDVLRAKTLLESLIR